MGLRFEFADSEVAVAWRRDDERASRGDPARGELALRFSAAQVTRDDENAPGGEVRGHMRAVELVCRGVRLPVPEAQHVGLLVDGRVEVEGRWLWSLPLPVTLTGPAVVELHFANGARFDFTADVLALTLPDRAVFTESLAC